MGSSRELINTTVDPVETIYGNYEREVRVKPWLADPEILTFIMAAAMEGRTISDAEMQGSNWWRTHTEAERHWLSLNASDPATANTLISDNRTRVADLFRQAGIDNASGELIDLVADQWTIGKWTEIYATNQIRLLADPNLTGNRDPLLTDFTTGLDSTRTGEEDVRQMIQTWLGPAYAANWNADHIASWASKFREDPDAKLELEDVLRKHRLALYPEHTNPNLTYEDIAAPWRGVFMQNWGQIPDETSSLFNQVVRMNNLAGAEQILRTEGLKTGNEQVSERFLSDINQALGGQIRRSDPAVL